MKTITSSLKVSTINLNDSQKQIVSSLNEASKKIAPLWSLENFVAVNPYLGHINKKFESVARELSLTGNISSTLPTSFYLEKWKKQAITEEDIQFALNKYELEKTTADFIQDVEANMIKPEKKETIGSVSDIATEITDKNWNRFIQERISNWAASFFDNGQATWKTTSNQNDLFLSWKFEASIDLTTEVSGLNGFRKLVKSFPDNPIEAVELALNKLQISKKSRTNYLYKLLLKHGGWAAYAARMDWENELYGGQDGVLIEFIAVLVCWEACLIECLDNKALFNKWFKLKEMFSLVDDQIISNSHLIQKLILQEAFEKSVQRELIQKFKNKNTIQKTTNSKIQAIFCIDVRSEVYRRHLELANDKIETLGFAGFFGFPVSFKPIGQDKGEAQCPVLLPTSYTVTEELEDKNQHELALKQRQTNNHVRKVWKTFKSGAITCFSYVSPIGLYFLPKLITDSFGLTRPVPHPDNVGLSNSSLKNRSINIEHSVSKDDNIGIPLEEQINLAKNALKAMSLTDNFAELVLIVGHGSTMVNNPHATGYDCGACGGHTGESNAKVAAEVLNNKKVRAALQNENIFIPVKTTFLACLHDTTSDELTIFNETAVPTENQQTLIELKMSLKQAGISARSERALRLNSDKSHDDKSILQRTKDWSQVRPEWGLAGCSTFIIAPRERSKGINLEGKSFLHSYNWKTDQNSSILEAIMTAPMIVTSWINLQYYGSTVDNKNYGAGNKTLHNVTSGLGVLEGYSGDLRVGLPFQAIHDGKTYQHEPIKLNVIIEAPLEEINLIIGKHEMVKNLCDNGWLHLLAMDSEGKLSHRYCGNLEWQQV